MSCVGLLFVGALVWSAPTQTYAAKATEIEHTFTFAVTNTGPQPEAIVALIPSCGCTVAKLPGKPWVIAPGATGEAQATIKPDLAALPPHPDRGYWRQLITAGKADSLMPAFGTAQGGPLDHDQIESLVEFLVAGH